MTEELLNPTEMIKPCRKVKGISAILLPFTETGDVDWQAYQRLLQRTIEAGLTPAVNMDTGFVNLLNQQTRQQVLQQAQEVTQGQPFVAGAFVNDHQQDSFNLAVYQQQMEQIQTFGGTPVIFQSFGLVNQQPDQIIDAYRQLAAECQEFLAFELTQQLAPFGSIYDLEVFEALLEIPQCTGAKHSSFERIPEWQRLKRRDQKRPDFRVFTGNDFAIDMIMYGSDYLLGLCTFAPDLFAKRDQFWETGDPQFYQLNDQLQYLGYFAFRAPSPAYKHSAAQFLHLRNWIASDQTHSESPERPSTDREILKEIGQRLNLY